MPEIRLVYFDIRGMAEPIRWMLKVAGEEFEDERIPLDTWGTQRKRRSSPDIQLGEKRRSNPQVQTGRFAEFIGQLPILYYDNFTLTQTHSVMRFIARRYGFNGESAYEEARAEEASELIFDLRLCIAAYHGTHFKSENPDIVRHTVFRDYKNEPDSPKKDEMKKEILEVHFPKYFSKFTTLYEKSKGKYITGNSLTYADLALANFFEIAEDLIDPDSLKEFPTLKALKEMVFEIPEIKSFVEAQRAMDKECPFRG